MMEWSVDTIAEKKCAVVPDEWIERVLESVDVPRGSFPIDPYQDYRLSSDRLPQAIENLQKAIDSRRRVNRAAIMNQLNLKQWQEWAAGALGAAEQKDTLLKTLLELLKLCAYARDEGKDILILGQ